MLRMGRSYRKTGVEKLPDYAIDRMEKLQRERAKKKPIKDRDPKVQKQLMKRISWVSERHLLTVEVRQSIATRPILWKEDKKRPVQDDKGKRSSCAKVKSYNYGKVDRNLWNLFENVAIKWPSMTKKTRKRRGAPQKKLKELSATAGLGLQKSRCGAIKSLHMLRATTSRTGQHGFKKGEENKETQNRKERLWRAWQKPLTAYKPPHSSEGKRVH